MKTKTQKMAPKTMLGTVRTQYVKCGKSNCKCSNGDLHGPYYYHVFRINGKRSKRYLKPNEVEQIRLACLERQKQEKEERKQRGEFWKRFRTLRVEMRKLHSQMNLGGALRNEIKTF